VKLLWSKYYRERLQHQYPEPAVIIADDISFFVLQVIKKCFKHYGDSSPGKLAQLTQFTPHSLHEEAEQLKVLPKEHSTPLQTQTKHTQNRG
jgi:hypothetical protein